MASVSAGKADEFAPGEMKVVNVDGEDVAVTNVDGAWCAFRNECTHQQVPLADGYGELEGRRITCALHDSAFDVKNGRIARGPAEMPLRIYKVRLEGDEVIVGED
jgi:nitrite reductase/ring-hydroxylating ferredoxin subunit